MTTITDLTASLGVGAFVLAGQTANLIQPTPSEDAATTAWVGFAAANGGTVSSTRRGIVDTFIKAVKAAGLWTTLDRYWLLAGEDAGSAKTDFKVGTLIVPTGTDWALTANVGYTGNGTTGYGNTTVDLSTLGGQYALNSATAGCQIQNSRTTSTDQYAFGSCNGAFTGMLSLVPLGSSGNDQFSRINEVVAGDNATSIANTRASWIITREGSTGTAIYKNGTVAGTARTATSAVLPTGPIYINALQFNGSPFGPSYSPDTISCFFFGSKWTAAQVTSFEAAQNAMMTSIGINVH
jgi:hypothetical protein